MPGWAIRARCPSGFGVKPGTVLTVQLEAGAAATLAQLRSEAATQAKVARDRLRIKAGFPPRELLGTPPGPDEHFTTVETAGLQNRDTVVLERAELGGGAGGAGSGYSGQDPRRKQEKRKASVTVAKSTGVHGLHGSTSPAIKPKKRRARPAKQWGAGHALGDCGEPNQTAERLVDATKAPVAATLAAGVTGAEAIAQAAAEERKSDLMFMVKRWD